MVKKAGKIWGETTEIFRSQTVSAHYLDIFGGGFCSYHRHEHKVNIFYVISGQLLIEQEVGEHNDKTTLSKGQSLVIAPGVWHKFTGMVDTKCIEIYQVNLTEPDIERRVVGGCIGQE